MTVTCSNNRSKYFSQPTAIRSKSSTQGPARRLTQVPLAHGVCLVSDLLQEAGQEGDPGGQSCRLVPLYGAPLSAQAPGVPPSEERGPAGGALGVHVVTGQDQSIPGTGGYQGGRVIIF